MSNSQQLSRKHETGINLQTGTAYTLALTDQAGAVSMNNASANNLTIPPNSSVPLPLGTPILVIQKGAGLTTLVAGAGVTTEGILVSNGRFTSLGLIQTEIDTWAITGGAGSTGPSSNVTLTTKGDVLSRSSAAEVRIPIGANGARLVPDSVETNGLRWEAFVGASLAAKSSQANVTGDATVYTVQFDDPGAGSTPIDQEWDVGDGLEETTGIWTCPSDGFYLISGCLELSGLVSGHTSIDIAIVATGSADPTYLWKGIYNAATMSRKGSCVLHLSATETLKMTVAVTGGTKVVDITAGWASSHLQITKLQGGANPGF